LSKQEEVFVAWQEKQKAMGRKVPDTTAPKYDTKQKQCTCVPEREEIKDALGNIIRVKTWLQYNPECMIHGQAIST
jgi:hypothetical protein